RAEVEQGGDAALVEERADGDHERLRRERSRGDDVDVLPRVVEPDLGVQQRLDDAVELRDPGAREQPAEDAAEADEADSVASADVMASQRRGGADGQVE